MRQRLASLLASVTCVSGIFLLASCGGHSSSPNVPSVPDYIIPEPPTDSADWSRFGYDDQRSGYNAIQTLITRNNVSTLKPKWVATTPAGGFANPLVADGTVYIADLSGHISAIQESTGTIQWSTGLGDALIGTPELYQGYLYEGSYSGHFFAINAATGAVQLAYPLPDNIGSIESSPIISHGVAIVGRSNLYETTACLTSAQLVQYSLTTPTIAKKLNLTSNGDSGVGVWSSPAIGPDGYLYIATGNSCASENSTYAGAIIKIDPVTLGIVWSANGPARGPAEDDDYGATPIFINGMIVDGAKDGHVYAFDTKSGALHWKTAAGIVSGSIIGSLATDGQRIYVPFSHTSTGGAIVALDPNGRALWSVATGAGSNGYDQNVGVLSAPTVSQGVVFAGFSEASCTPTSTVPCSGVSALDAQTGSLFGASPSQETSGRVPPW